MNIRDLTFVSRHHNFDSADAARKQTGAPDDFILRRVTFFKAGKRVSQWWLMAVNK